MTTIVKVFHHISEKDNPVYIYNVIFEGNTVVSVFSMNVAKMFKAAVDCINNDDMPMIEREMMLAPMLHIVHHINNKLEGIGSVSTSCLHNAICLERMKTDSICKHCYAASQQAMQHGLNDHNALNAYILQRHLFSEEVLASIPLFEMFCRIESFGDVANVIQARNYIRIIKAHPLQKFGIWSKNIAIWKKAFEEEGKPENTTFVQSSIRMNERETVKPDCKWFVDHVFTVWENEQVAENAGVKINCGGRKCRTCLKCYNKNDIFYIDELKK